MSSRRVALFAVLLALTVSAQAVAGVPHGWQNKLDRALQQAVVQGESLQRVIVQARPAIPLAGPTGQYDLLTQGTGGLTAAGALKLAAIVNLSGPLGAGCLPYHVNPSTLIGGAQATWAQNIVWGENLVCGENIVWGENLVWADNIVWGENIVWADDTVRGEPFVWGENIVWADNIVSADNIVWADALVGTMTEGGVVWGVVRRPDLTVWSDWTTSSQAAGGVR